MGDGNISQDDIDSILASLTGDAGGGGDSSSSSNALSDDALSGLAQVAESGKSTVTKAKEKEKLDTENIPLLLDVQMELSVVLGSTKRPIREVLDLGKSSVIELDRFVGEDVDVYINDQLIGKGRIVAIDDEYGIRITKIVNPIKKPSFKK